MSFAFVGVTIGATLATGALSYGLSAATQPNQPDLASSSKELSDTEAAMLPVKRQLEALAQQGRKGTITIPAAGKNPARSITVDFTGIGSADVQSAVAQKMAKLGLDQAQKYDSQFIEQSLAQQKLADPESFAARDKMDALIQSQINRPMDQPVAELLQKQVGDELTAAQAGRLDPEMQAMLDQATEAALSQRGGDSGVAGDFAGALTTGSSGEARRAAALQKAQGWLASGATPEDTAYRREQQNIGNLSAEVTGQTPTSQFGAMSGAQQGPTPNNFGAALSQMPTNTTQTGANAAIAQANAQASQANPWLAGMSALLNVGSAAGKAGWKPFG